MAAAYPENSNCRLALAIALATAALSALLLPARASAQQSEQEAKLNLQRFRPPLGRYDLFNLSSAQTARSLDWSLQLFGTYAANPLVLRQLDGRRVALISDQGGLDLGFSLGLFNFAEVSVALPINASLGVTSAGEPLTGTLTDLTTDAAVTGLRVTPKLQLLRGEHYHLGISSPIEVPFGAGSFIETQGTSYNPRLLLEYAGPFRLIANAGVILRDRQRYRDLQVGNAFTAGLGTSLPLIEARHSLELIGTLEGEGYWEQTYTNEMPVEALAALRWTLPSNVALTLGGGAGVHRGYGAPDYRIVAGIAFAPRAPAPKKRPQEVKAEAAKAEEPPPPPSAPLEPLVAGSVQAQTEAGKEIPITLLDQVQGAAKGEVTIHELGAARSGAAYLLSDRTVRYVPKKGFIGVDTFPYEVRDSAGRSATGAVIVEVAPPPDSDGDGIPDEADKCPREPETYNGYQDEDGCPDTPPAGTKSAPPEAKLVGDKIVITDQIYFASARDTILKRSYPLLESVAKVLRNNPHVAKVRIEGHTDNVGTSATNLELSKRRANTVKNHLIQLGIAPERLESEGYGQTQPIVPNSTAKGRSLNRRVAFSVVEQEAR